MLPEGEESNAAGKRSANCLKVPFFIINVLTWIGGGGLIGMAIWLVSTDNEFKHFIQNQNIFIVYITLAAVLFTAGIFGTCGILLGNKCLLQAYFVVVCLVFCTLFGLVIFGVVERSRVDKIIRDSWNKTNDETRIFIQEKFDCCDISLNNTGTKSHADKSCFVNITNRAVKQNCFSKLTEWFEDNQIAIASGGSGVMLLLIFLMVTSCWFITKLKSKRSIKRVRVSPAQLQNEKNNNDMPNHRDPGQVNEMVAVEESSEPSYDLERRRDEAKTAKKKRSHQRNAWAKKTSNSPLVG